MKIIKPISLVLSLFTIFSLASLNNNKIASANENTSEEVVYETDFEGMNISSTSTADVNTGFIWAQDWKNTKTVKRNNSNMLDISINDSSTYSTVGGFGIADKSNLAKCKNGEAYNVSTYFEMENLQYMFVEFVGGSGKWGSVIVYPNGDIKENVGGTNMSNVSYINNVLKFTYTMSFNGNENVNGYIKFTAYNAQSAHLYIDNVSISKAKYLIDDGYEFMPEGVFNTRNVGLHTNYYAEAMTTSSFVKENDNMKAKMDFTLSQNTAGEAVFYINKLGFLNKNREYDVSFDMVTTNIERMWIYHGGTWMSSPSYAQIEMSNNNVILTGDKITGLTYTDNKVSMDFNTNNATGDWMQFQFIVQVKEANKASSVSIDNLRIFQHHIISEISLDVSDAKVKYLYGEDFDATGLVVNALYTNDTNETIDINDCMISGYNPTLIGKQQITVTYKGVSANYEITIKRQVESLLVNVDDLKVEYNYGEQIDLSNIEVKVVYLDDGSTDNLNHDAAVGGYSIDLGGYDPYTPGTYTITIYYLDVKETFEVIVKSNGNISFDDITYEETGK